MAAGPRQGILRVAERVFAQLARTDPPSAAMKAVELALAWLTRGDLNIGQGWMNRARRLLDGAPEGPAHGYLAYLDAVVAVLHRGPDALAAAGADAARHRAAGWTAPRSRALCRRGRGARRDPATPGWPRRTALIDEAMLPVLADEVPIEWAGDIYCVVLHHCHRLADLPRMRAWTQSMERWCDDFAASANYGGVCDVHRLQLQAATDDYRGLLEDRLAPRQPGAGGGQQLGGRRGLLPTRRGAPAARRRRRRVRRVRAGPGAGHRSAAR